jgi:hypothetical protein
LRSNTKGYGGKTHLTDSQNRDTTAPSVRELYHLQFSLQAASPETFGYTLVCCHYVLHLLNLGSVKEAWDIGPIVGKSIHMGTLCIIIIMQYGSFMLYNSRNWGTCTAYLDVINQFTYYSTSGQCNDWRLYKTQEKRPVETRRQVLSSVTRMLRSQVRILLGAWMCVCVFVCCVVLCVGRGLATGRSSVQGVLPIV